MGVAYRHSNSAIGAVGEGVEVAWERIGPQNDLIVSGLHGSMTEQARSKKMFHAASQAATTTTIALAAVYTGLCLSNPAASGKLLIPRFASAALEVAPAAAAPVALHGGYLAAGITSHTTPLAIYNNFLGSAIASVAKADAACTTVGVEEVIMPLMGAMTDDTLHGTTPALVDLQGCIIIPPGGWLAFFTLTVVVGWFGMTWEEIDE